MSDGCVCTDFLHRQAATTRHRQAATTRQTKRRCWQSDNNYNYYNDCYDDYYDDKETSNREDTRRPIAGAYIVSTQHSDMEGEKLHWYNSEDPLETINCVGDIEHFVRELLGFQVTLVANENGAALQT